MFDHYLITRFNLRNPKWEVTKNHETLLTDEWMEDRMWLFETFCFPSVVAQTNTNFSWILYLDTTTTDKYKQRMQQLVANHPNIHLFYIDGMPAFSTEAKKLIAQRSADKSYIITSRIDNDDCIHQDFINEIQQKFDSQAYQVIDIINGYSLQIKPNFMLGKKDHIFNPFISLIEKNNNPKTVWSNDHTMWKNERRVTQIKGKRLWMSIIHEKNKVNEFNGYGDVSWEAIKSDFNVSNEIDDEITAKLIPHKKWRYLSLRNSVHIKFEIFSKLLKKRLGIYKIKQLFSKS